MIIDHLCVNYGAPFFEDLFLALKKRNIEQNVFYPRNKKHVPIISGQAFRVDSPLVLGFLTKASFRWKRRIMKEHYYPLFQRNKPDIIHAHTLFSDGSLADYYYRWYGVPFIVAVRSTDVDVFLKYKPWLKRHSKQILKNARYIIFISASLKNKFQEIFGLEYESKSAIIPNGINQSYFSTDNREDKELHTPMELLYVGSFLKRKRVPDLIRLVDNIPARLTIVGAGGGSENKVSKMVTKSKKVTFLGKIKDQSRLKEIYRNSDIFIMASQRETFGLVYIEAMSQGLPVIYSKNTGIDGFFVQGSVGYPVTPGSIREMQQGLEKINSSYQEISKNCIEEARRFNWVNIAESYTNIYTEIAGSVSSNEFNNY
jgi:glycosyltransferase involved in cell wall biosynthesis